MAEINIPAVATGAFLGLLAIIVLISCVPPVTRFLGDLCCCPWHIPFTKKRRRNADEEMDKDDLPYVAGPPSPRAGSPVDDVGYHRVSAAYMSAVSVVDHELVKEDGYRSRPESQDYYQHHQRRSDYYNHPHSGANSGTHLQVPGAGGHHSAANSWRGASPHSHSSSPNHSSTRVDYPTPSSYQGHASSEGYGSSGYGDQGYYDPYAYGEVQRPQHAYSPPEMSMQHGYFPPRAAGGYDDGYYNGGGNYSGGNNSNSTLAYQHSSEYLTGPRQHPRPQV